VFLQSVRPCGCTDVFLGDRRSRPDAAADAFVQVVGGEADVVELMPRIQHIVHNREVSISARNGHSQIRKAGAQESFW
jgi:hypothetical protein